MSGSEAAQSDMTLPPEVRTALHAAYQDYATAVADRSPRREKAGTYLANLADTGRRAGWSFRALAEPCGITPERLRQIVNKWSEGKRIRISFPKRATPPRPEPRPKTRRSHLTSAEAALLAELAPLAKKNMGSRPLDSPYRKASEEFSALLKKHHTNGVTWQELSEATKGEHTTIGVRMRAHRHGYGAGAPPSIMPYRRVVLHAPKVEDPEPAANAEPKATANSKSAVNSTAKPKTGAATAKTTRAKTTRVKKAS